ncbi:hypothetical protein F4823DRAFT_575643 [Ustulina deusta]|nr:hypothetical protein F4823DRAFT_575643 [Ustulina deusta]
MAYGFAENIIPLIPLPAYRTLYNTNKQDFLPEAASLASDVAAVPLKAGTGIIAILGMLESRKIRAQPGFKRSLLHLLKDEV